MSVTHSPLSESMSSCFKQKEGQSKKKKKMDGREIQKLQFKLTPSGFTTHIVDTGKLLSKW